MKIEDMVFESRCQKCDSSIVITPLAEFKGPIEGTLFFPDNNLHCAKCMAIMTTAIRKIRNDEKPEKE